jgi:hypothetical protein
MTADPETPDGELRECPVATPSDAVGAGLPDPKTPRRPPPPPLEGEALVRHARRGAWVRVGLGLTLAVSAGLMSLAFW